jgi:uncharacterized coiled-coil protein SlyX
LLFQPPSLNEGTPRTSLYASNLTYAPCFAQLKQNRPFTPTMSKRTYNRRTPEQLIADLEAKIAFQKEKIEAKSMANDPVLKEVPKIKRQLRKFAEVANAGGRKDIANSVTAFVVSLDRMWQKG